MDKERKDEILKALEAADKPDVGFSSVRYKCHRDNTMLDFIEKYKDDVKALLTV